MPKSNWSKTEIKILKTLDQDKEKSRAYHKFKMAIKTPSTLKSYNYALDKFMIQSKIKSYDEAIKFKIDRIQDYLEDYIISLNGLSYQTANQYLSGVELFFDMNMVLYHKRILRKLLPKNDKEQGGKLPYTTEEIQRMLSVTIKLRSKAVIHFFASTGCRPASIEDPVLRLKHVEDMPNKCKSIYVYDGSKEGYFVFLTPEASKALDDYFKQRKLNGEILTDESPMFANSENFPTTKQHHISQSSARQIIKDAIKKSSIERTMKNGRYDKAEMYGFRKRFNTILKLNNSVNSNIAEKLMAHKRGLDGVYLQPTKEECFTEFYKAVTNLTINENEKQKAEIQKLQEEKSELEEKNQRIDELEKRFEKQLAQDEKAKKVRDDYFELISSHDYDPRKDAEYIEFLKTKKEKSIEKQLEEMEARNKSSTILKEKPD